MIDNVIAQLHYVPDKDKWQETARPISGINVMILHTHAEENNGLEYVISVDQNQALHLIQVLQKAIEEGKQYPTLKQYVDAKYNKE